MSDETTPRTTPAAPHGLTRRHALAGAAIVGVAVPTLAACGSDSDDSATDATSSSSSPSSAETTADPGGSSSSSAAGDDGFASTSDIPEGGGAIFKDDGVVVTQPTAGEFKGFSNICTHQGCPLADVTDTINCNCHGSKFSITDGSVTQGPASEALPEVEISVSGTSIAKA